ncbi:MAG TPA: hypothetical protein VKX17_28825 [Planctomycetota bacterium]|nr:hypothetical protein [Planctomycetota bacterium]
MSTEQNERSGLIIPAQRSHRAGVVAILVLAIGLVVAVLGIGSAGFQPARASADGAPTSCRLEAGAPQCANDLTSETISRAAGVPPLQWNDGFSAGPLNPSIWGLNVDGDFSERLVDVISSKKSIAPEYYLRLRAATMNTRDDTVKFLGAYTLQSFPLSDATIAVDLDWNNQANGCYMSAGLILAPEAASGNPLNGDNWLKVEYIGVPPGKNARIEISVKQDSRQRTLFNEGWPEKNRAGRPIAVQHLEIHTQRGSVAVLENGAKIFESRTRELSFNTGHVYLQMSSHSNYPPREIYFRGLMLSFER